MFKHIGFGEIVNIFILPFVGFAMCLVWYFKHKNEDSVK
jgi:hypothetical protein